VDKFWALKDIMFDWTADLTGTGNKSEYIVEISIVLDYIYTMLIL